MGGGRVYERGRDESRMPPSTPIGSEKRRTKRLIGTGTSAAHLCSAKSSRICARSITRPHEAAIRCASSALTATTLLSSTVPILSATHRRPRLRVQFSSDEPICSRRNANSFATRTTGHRSFARCAGCVSSAERRRALCAAKGSGFASLCVAKARVLSARGSVACACVPSGSLGRALSPGAPPRACSNTSWSVCSIESSETGATALYTTARAITQEAAAQARTSVWPWRARPAVARASRERALRGAPCLPRAWRSQLRRPVGVR